MDAVNYVAKLNEYAQARRLELKYEDVGSAGPDHIKTFTVRAVLNGKAYPDGVGKNKKVAKQNAAENTLRALLEQPLNSTENATEAPTTPVRQTSIHNIINYISWLNEYGHKNRVSIRPIESTRLGPNNTTHFVVGDKEYPAAYGKTKKEAKEEAAKLVYDEIHCSKTTETGHEKYISSSQPEEELNQNVSDICDKTKRLTAITTDEGFTEINFVGLVNKYCQKTKLSHDYVFEKTCGPQHDPQFFYKLVINNKDYSVGEGKSVKEAKQNAAQLAWSALLEQSDCDSKLSAVSDDAALSRLSTPPNTPKSRDAESKSLVSNPPKVSQIQSPDVKSKIRIAANFPNAHRHSKEDMANFNGKNTGNSHSENTTNSVVSRFTSEFDSIVCLGKGAFGLVFKAKQKLVKRYYAIKIVRCKEKSLREVGALSELQHCNIVRYYNCWLEDSGYQLDSAAGSGSSSQSTDNSSIKYLYIQMELCDTKTLRVWIDEKNIQNVKKSLRDSKRREESLAIFLQIVNGVQHLHSKMLIHRDMKPANILFGQNGEVKIGDFGLVTAENDDNAESVMERTVYKGTPSYMAPEQKSRNMYDRKVDIFALGLIYFELLWNLPSGIERKPIWDDARNQKLPQGFLHNFSLEVHQHSLFYLTRDYFLQGDGQQRGSSDAESQIIKSMLCVKPEDRPEAGKLKVNLEEYSHTHKALKDMCRDSKTV